MAKVKHLKKCKNGHDYYKSSDCPVCPICAQENKPVDGFLSLLAAPARRALQNEGISSLEQLSKYTKQEILNLHGMGKSSLPKLETAMKKEGFCFKNLTI